VHCAKNSGRSCDGSDTLEDKGTSTYPDATFTLRPAFGVVKGFESDGKRQLNGFGVAIPSCTGSSRMERLRAAMIDPSGPTGKGVVNAMSDLDVTSFTTRPRPARIFKMRATWRRSLTTE